MTPKEVLEMRNRFSEEVYRQFGEKIDLHTNSLGLADWLIESGWITEAPDEDPH